MPAPTSPSDRAPERDRSISPAPSMGPFSGGDMLPSGFRKRSQTETTRSPSPSSQPDEPSRESSRSEREPTQKFKSTEEKVMHGIKNFASGLVNPIASLLRTPRNFAIGAATIVGVTGLTVATGGATIPYILAIGGGLGIYQLGKAAHHFLHAKSDHQRSKSLFYAGEGVTTLGFTALGTHGALGAGGLALEEVGVVTAMLEAGEVAPELLAEAEVIGSSSRAYAGAATAVEETRALQAAETVIDKARRLTPPNLKSHSPEDSKRAARAKPTPLNNWGECIRWFKSFLK